MSRNLKSKVGRQVTTHEQWNQLGDVVYVQARLNLHNIFSSFTGHEQLVTDGKFSPELEAQIRAFQVQCVGGFAPDGWVGKTESSSKTLKYLNLEPDQLVAQAKASAPGVIKRFQHKTLQPMELRRGGIMPDGARAFNMSATFKVELELEPSLPDPERYEYRQYIRGHAWIQDSSGTMVHGHSDFAIPAQSLNYSIPRWGGGLHSLWINRPKGLTVAWKEDGYEDPVTGAVERYGHRATAGSTPHFLKNHYSPDGYSYEGGDVPALEGRAIVGLRVFFSVEFIGKVLRVNSFGTAIENSVAEKQWSYLGSQMITSISPFRVST